MRFAIGLLTGILVTCLIPLIVIAAGAVNMAAIHGPGVLEQVFGSWAYERWVQTSAPEEIPTSPPTTESWVSGFEHYRSACVVCHGAPGVEPADFARFMSPRPPDLARSTRGMTDEQLYLVIHDGVRMTGMPGFGRILTEQHIAHLVRFLRDMEHISPEQQRELMDAARLSDLGTSHPELMDAALSAPDEDSGLPAPEEAIAP